MSKGNNQVEQKHFNIWKAAGLVTIFIIVTIIVPIVLEYFVFRNNFYSAISNSDWSGFLGSFLGGIIGGLGTLIAVYISVKHTSKIQEKMEKQLREDRVKDNEYKARIFCNEIADSVSEYIADISKFFYNVRIRDNMKLEEKNLIKEREKLTEEIEKKYIEKVDTDDLDEVINHSNQTDLLKYKTNNIKSEIHRLQERLDFTIADRTKAINCFFLINIKLKGIVEGRPLIVSLKDIHNKVGNPSSLPHGYIENAANVLINQTEVFRETYLEAVRLK